MKIPILRTYALQSALNIPPPRIEVRGQGYSIVRAFSVRLENTDAGASDVLLSAESPIGVIYWITSVQLVANNLNNLTFAVDIPALTFTDLNGEVWASKPLPYFPLEVDYDIRLQYDETIIIADRGQLLLDVFP